MNYNKNLDLWNLLPQYWKSYLDKSIIDNTTKNLRNKIENSELDFYPYIIDNIFKVFQLCKLNHIKVVILGQDPYYANKTQANGIAFSVNSGVPIPPSLRNIFKELGKKDINSGDLTHWVEQGVFLLNTSLTVQEKSPNSHVSVWKSFTEHIIDIIEKNCENIIFVAWGKGAEKHYHNIDCRSGKHQILMSSHPSPLSCYKTDKPFIGSDIFNKINLLLEKMNKAPISWLLSKYN